MAMTRSDSARSRMAVILAGLLLFAAEGTRAAAPPLAPAPTQGAVPAPAPDDKGVPVTLDGKTILIIHESLEGFSPEERAKAGEARLLRIAEDPFYSEDLFRIEEGDTKATIYYGERVAGVVTQEDAARAGVPSAELASRVLETVKKAIHQYRGKRLPAAWVRVSIFVGLATLLLVGSLFLLGRIHRGLVDRWRAAQTRKNLPLPLDQAVPFVVRGLKVFRGLATVLLFVAYLQYVFAVVPLTQRFALGVLHYLLDPLQTLWLSLLESVGDFFFIFVLVVLTRYLLKGLRWALSGVAKGEVSVPGVSPEWAKHLYKLLRLLVLAIAAVMIYPYIPGSNSAAFKGISLFVGAVFTLGFSATAGSVIGGLTLIFTGAFHIGDLVRIGDVTGDVVECSLTLTRIRTLKNEIVTIPNGAVLSGRFVNYSALARREGLILHTSVTIGYDAPWRKVHDLLVQAALRTSRILSEPAPFVLQTSLNDFHITYEINAYTRDANAMPFTYGELHQNIQDAFNDAGVEILSPQYASLRDGNVTTIPESYRPRGGRPRSFAVRMDNSEEKPAEPGTAKSSQEQVDRKESATTSLP